MVSATRWVECNENRRSACYGLIATLRLWARPRLVPADLLVASFWLGTGLPIVWGNGGRFSTEVILPAPLRADGGGWDALWPWLEQVLVQ